MRSRSLRSGFTLIELVIVLLVMGIVVATSVPNLSAMLSPSALERSVDAVVTVLRAERLEAVRTGVPRRLSITDEDGIRTAGGRVMLAEGVVVRKAAQDDAVTFYPTGLSSGGAWRLEGATGASRLVRVSLLESGITVEP